MFKAHTKYLVPVSFLYVSECARDSVSMCVYLCQRLCVRVPDNATPVSRLAVTVAMVMLANRSHRSGLSLSSA